MWIFESKILTRITGPNTNEVTRIRMREGHLSRIKEGDMGNAYKPCSQHLKGICHFEGLSVDQR
jgi:hypothetical protein